MNAATQKLICIVKKRIQYFLVKDILSVLVFISDPLLSYGGFSLDKHRIIWELEGNLLKHRLKATVDRIWCFIMIIYHRDNYCVIIAMVQ